MIGCNPIEAGMDKTTKLTTTRIPLELTGGMEKAIIEANDIPLTPVQIKRIYDAIIVMGMRHEHVMKPDT